LLIEVMVTHQKDKLSKKFDACGRWQVSVPIKALVEMTI
jgi:hypothetical protein